MMPSLIEGVEGQRGLFVEGAVLLFAGAQGRGLAFRQESKAAVEHGSDERQEQDQKGCRRDCQSKAGLAQVGMAVGMIHAWMCGEDGSLHGGVVHARDGTSHHNGGDESLKQTCVPEGEPSATGCSADGDQDRDGNPQASCS
jgi:hypothetical protein